MLFVWLWHIRTTMETKLKILTQIYDRFIQDTEPFRTHAVCEKGCAFCCTDAGSIDVTTLEALRIRTHLKNLPRPKQVTLAKALTKDAKRREKNEASACPFLSKNRACSIYDIRPFSCRRIYSLKKCGPEQPPQLHRQAMQIAKNTLTELQKLDITGYSGHIAFIIYMLEAPKFLATYLAGDCRPEEVMVYGKTHKIVINRMMVLDQ